MAQASNLMAAPPASAVVGVASSQVLAGNVKRQGLILVNTSANGIYLAFDAPAVIGAGIFIGPNGGAYTMQAGNLNRGAVNAIATGAGSNLGIQEFTSSVQ